MASQRSLVTPVRRESVEKTIERLVTFIGRMERRYECSSDSMATAVVAGTMRETTEIARWLNDYRTLQRLREQTDSDSLTSTTTTS